MCIACSNNNQKEDTFTLQLGDLLFQDLDSSPLCDAIEIVTTGYKGANLSHVGIIIEDKIPSLPYLTATDFFITLGFLSNFIIIVYSVVRQRFKN